KLHGNTAMPDASRANRMGRRLRFSVDGKAVFMSPEPHQYLVEVWGQWFTNVGELRLVKSRVQLVMGQKYYGPRIIRVSEHVLAQPGDIALMKSGAVPEQQSAGQVVQDLSNRSRALIP